MQNVEKTSESDALESRDIKVVLSDLHIGRGDSWDEFKWDREFEEFVEKLPEIAGEPSRTQIVLNGDILDMIKGSWRDGKVRKSDVVKFIEDCHKAHKRLFLALSRWVELGGEIVWVVGNHDHPLASQEISELLCKTVGFPIRFYLREFFDRGLWIEHGHRYEVLNRTDTKNVWIKSEDGEEVLNIPWGSKFVLEVINPLVKDHPYFDRIRPLSAGIKWGLLFHTTLALKALFKTFLFVVKNRRFYDPVRRRYFRVPMKLVFHSLGSASVDKAGRTLLENPKIQAVVMGHTHRALIFKKDGKVYANSGTWVPFVSVQLPYFGLVDRKTFVLAKFEGSRWDVKLFVWHGVEKAWEEVYPEDKELLKF